MYELSIIVELLNNILEENSCPEVFYLKDSINRVKNNLRLFLKEGYWIENDVIKICQYNAPLFDTIAYANYIV